MVYPIGKRIILGTAKIWIKDISGLENIPKNTQFIIAANHGSYFDDIAIAPIIINILNKKVHMYCNDSFFSKPLIGSFLRWAACIPVRVSDKKTKESHKVNDEAFKDALGFLRKNEPIGVFPEGHRSYKGGRLREAKTGVAKLALTANVPVLPIGVNGSWDILPVGSSIPQLKRCTISIGKPLYFDKYYKKKNDKKTLKKITTAIMKDIARLCGRRYNY